MPSEKPVAARAGSSRIRWVNAGLLGWKPPRAYQIWHDRAVFHFLVSPADRAAYLATMRAALPGGGAVILAAFAAEGGIPGAGGRGALPPRPAGLAAGHGMPITLAAIIAGAGCASTARD